VDIFFKIVSAQHYYAPGAEPFGPERGEVPLVSATETHDDGTSHIAPPAPEYLRHILSVVCAVSLMGKKYDTHIMPAVFQRIDDPP
jgi:hypothetical protein